MTLEEILRQQFEMLAERSKTCNDKYVSEITSSMIAVYSLLEPSDSSAS